MLRRWILPAAERQSPHALLDAEDELLRQDPINESALAMIRQRAAKLTV